MMRSISLINHPRLLDIEKWRRVSISSSDSKTLISDFLNQLHCNIFQMRNAGLGTQIHCPNADMFSETSKENFKVWNLTHLCKNKRLAEFIICMKNALTCTLTWTINQSSKELLKFETLHLKVKSAIITLTITNSTSVI